MNPKLKWMAIGGVIFATLLAGCQSGNQNQPASSENAAQPAQKAEGKKGGGEGRSESKPTTVTIPAGTPLSARLAGTIDTGTTQEGASFEATLASPLSAGGVEVAPVGSALTGRVTHVVSSGRLSKPAELSLTLTTLTVGGGQSVDISTSTWSMKGESHKKRNIEMIGGGAAAGALIGALTGGKKGAAIGTAVGAGGGTGVAAGTGKKEIRLASETKLSFKLSEAVTLTAR